MKKTNVISQKIKKRFALLLDVHPLVRDIAKVIHAKGGRTLLVGGAVRDLFLVLPIKDLDIEVYGLTPDQLKLLLQSYGTVSLIGKLFGVFRLHGLDVDWSLPRADSPGRKPAVKIDPFMKFENAFIRRDLTINAMGIDIQSYELIDPFGGYGDLQNRLLRTPNEYFFVQDPLRFFRVMQFVARFEMLTDDKLTEICKKMDITTVSQERIETEFEKMFLKSRYPSRGIRWAYAIGRLAKIFPSLFATVGLQQNSAWHAEHDLFEHTMQTVDAMAVIVQKYENPQTKLILFYAALCHDLGKVTTTKKVEGVFKSIGHAKESARLTDQILKQITHKKNLITLVILLVRYHMMPIQLLASNATITAYKRLAHKLAPWGTLQQLADLFLADKQGRNPHNALPFTKSDREVTKFLRMADEARVRETVEKPILQGRDLLEVVTPGPKMGLLLKKAYQIQLEEGIRDKKILKQRVLQDIK